MAIMKSEVVVFVMMRTLPDLIDNPYKIVTSYS